MAQEHHPQCVLLAPTPAGARDLAEWLTNKGFPAEAIMPSAIATSGDSLGISEEAFAGIEVRVIDPEHVALAKQAITEMRDEIAAVREREVKRAQRTGTVTAVCEECGQSSEWPAAAMGTTEVCPHCSSYMDVPDPDDDWGDVDFGAEDEDNGEK